MMPSSKIILGIDPGTVIMGYAVVAAEQSKVRLLHMDVLKLISQKDTYQRLEVIFSKVSELIKIYQPTMFAIEAPFFGKNVQSMLKLGRAQGVAIAAAMDKKIPVTEYSPKKVKQSITGNGNAGKDQVMKMLQTLLSFTGNPKQYDATDALAVAMCHHFQLRSVIGKTTKGAKGWEDFIMKNPGRLLKK